MKLTTLPYLILCSLFFLIIACQQKKSAVPISSGLDIDSARLNEYQEVSLISLIANPEKYNKRHVRVIGYLNLEFEGNGLYFHKEDYDRAIEKNGLWVEMSRDSIFSPQIKKCNRKYVLIEGTFDSENTGHKGMWSGSLKDIKRLEVWQSLSTLPASKP
ncbi:hypothetical protein NAF17_03140 [Mucilaginibacter sp. RB4R14]|uniref:hypothetical protein n=1 Tax=Mucilaginibacter aurantiaciroseus TaxID=2949308 RepID=UPI002090338E|nr:hypothetical protein [Mucilaginibacter aurantiaciroseus]MCO5934525.1 hypothetical protein [Mucilaginibacter aurantiaciroseus]